MFFCAKCGSELDPNSAFCGSCGAPAPGAEAAPGPVAAPAPPPPAAPAPPGTMPVPPPMTGGAPAYGPPAAPAPMPYQPPRSGGGGKAVLFILLGLLAIGVIVLLLLGFAVGPKWFVSDSGGGPEKVMDSFFQDMASGNVKGLVALIEPSAAKELLAQIEDYGYDTLDEFFTEFFQESFPENDLKITGLKYKTAINGNSATVDIIDGKATYTDSYGDKITETVGDGDNVFSDTTYNLKKVGDKWYLMPEM